MTTETENPSAAAEASPVASSDQKSKKKASTAPDEHRESPRLGLQLAPGPSTRSPFTKRTFPSLSDAIEAKTKRTVSIAMSTTSANLAKCNSQSQSRLFSLPRELRDLIYEFALSPWDNRARPYGTREYYYRPDRVAKHMVLTDLLLSCRRVWLEANTKAIKQWRPAFWCGRGPGGREEETFFPNMTDNNLRNVTNIQIHMQMFEIEPMADMETGEALIAAFFDPSLRRRGFNPRILRITIRHTDWWYWEDDEPLRLEDGWVQALLNAPLASCVEMLELELETLERKKDQLEPIVERLRKLGGMPRRVSLVDPDDRRATKLVSSSKKPKISHWTGKLPSNAGLNTGRKEGKTWDYHIALLTWRAVPCPMPSPPVSNFLDSTTGLLLPPYEPSHVSSARFLLPPSSTSHPRFCRLNDWAVRQPLAPDATALCHFWSVCGWDAMAAQCVEDARREQFAQVMARVEIQKVERRWREERSLMEFAD